MRFIKMTGGLGNQLFIYAFYLRMRHSFPGVRIDLSDMVHYHVHHGYELHRVFGLPTTEFCINQAVKKVIEFLFFRKIYERKQSIDSTDWAFRKAYRTPFVYFKGFFQSERYFADIRDEVRRTFRFDLQRANAKSRSMAAIIDADEHAVSIHIRRGDYLQPKHWALSGCVCQLPYYRHALAEMARRFPSAHYYVFSDDLQWVKENLPLAQAQFIDWNRGADSWQDMMLMSRCRHHIICNSTFSWWGAWLNPRSDKLVLVPERWFQGREAPHIYPEGWIRVPVDE